MKVKTVDARLTEVYADQFLFSKINCTGYVGCKTCPVLGCAARAYLFEVG